MRRTACLLVPMGMLCCAPSAFGGELVLGTVQAQPGGEVTVAVSYSQGMGTAAAGVVTDIRFDSRNLLQPRCAPGAALSRRGTGQKTVKCSEPRLGLLRMAVYGLNLDPVSDGEVATVTFRVAPHAPAGAYRLQHRPSAADADGRDFTLLQRAGAVEVGQK